MEKPLRYHRTFGLNAEQLDELEERIEDILPGPWNKGIGRPKSLSLREAIMVTLLYKRQNMIEEVIGYLFGISQGTVSDIITEFTPLIARATEEFRPDAEEARQMTRGRLALVDGTLWPCWSWERDPELWAGKYKTTGHGPRSQRIVNSTRVNTNTITRSVPSALPSSVRLRISRPGRSFSPITGDLLRWFLDSFRAAIGLYFFELSFQ